MLVSSDNTPASNAVLQTAGQFTSPNAALAPIAAAADCATVFKARTPAALNHFLIPGFTVS